MRLQIEIGTIGDALDLTPTPGEQVLNVIGRLGVVRKLICIVGANAKSVLAHAEVRVPGEAVLNPLLMDLFIGARLYEVLDLHHLELACAEDEAAGRNLVAERLADLRDAEWQPLAR